MPGIILVSLAAFLFFGCSDPSPNAKMVSYWTVCDFSGEREDVSFCVFAQFDGELDNTASISVTNESAGLKWKCDSPVVFENSFGKWVGCTDFCGISGAAVPEGEYQFVYGDRRERESSVFFRLSYPDFFKDGISAEKIRKSEAVKVQNVALYDDEGALVFYGEEKSEWQDVSEILREYKSACKMKRIVVLRNCRIMAVTDVVDLENENY